MAADIGVKVSIDGYQEFKKQIQDITQSQKTLKSEMQAVSSAWDKSTSAEKKAAEQKKNLAQQIENQKKKIDELEQVLSKVEDKYGENSREAESWREKLNQATAELNSMKSALHDIPNGIEQMGTAMQSAGEKLSAMGDKLMPISAAAAALGVVAVKTTADFDSSMSKVSAISGATGKDFDALRQKAREMGAETKFSASEAADAFTYMAMAGWKTEEMMQGIDGIMSLSAADGLDLATTSDIVTDSLSAFGLTAKDSAHFADVLAAASTNANTNVSMMGETFKYAAPVAGALGFSVEDVATAVGLMANAGIKGSQAGTALRGWLTRMAKPTKESAAAMDFLDIEIQNADGSMKDLSEIIRYTKLQFDTLNEAEKAQYAAMLAGQNGMSGLLAIMNASEDDIAKLSKAIKSANGTAKDMAETMQDNLNGQLTILKSQLSEAAISIGDALIPKIREATSVVQAATDWFNNLSDEEKQLAINAGIATAAAAPLLKVLGGFLTVSGKAVESIGGMVKAIGEMGGVANALNATLGMTSVQLGLVAAPLVILAAAFIDANNKITGLDSELINLKRRLAETGTAIDDNGNSLQAWTDNVETVSEGFTDNERILEHWRKQLNKCYDENGNLKEGMQATAEVALTQLNKAMGSDYSTEFIAQAKDSAAALGEINAAIDDNIAKMKERALQAAFTDDYTSALKNQVEAHKNLNEANLQYQQTVDGAKKAVQEFEAAQKEAAKTNATGGVANPEAVARLSEATKKCNEYRIAVADAGKHLQDATRNAGTADSVIDGLNKTMELMAESGADNINKAADAYANISTNAEKAGQKAEEAAGRATKSFEDIRNDVLQSPSFDQEDAAQKAKTTTETMQGTFDSNKLTGHVDKVDGGEEATKTADTSMQSVLDSNKLTGHVEKVDGAEAAARDARSAMQSFLDNHPIIATVVETVTGGRISRHASGGFVEQKQLSWLAEDGAEVVIPLSASHRQRALDLYEQTGAALGIGSYAALPDSTTYNTTNNNGGNTINVYGAPGQDVTELAHEVADIINGEVQMRGAVWA